MDEKKLSDILHDIKAPKADENAKKIALNLALAEFDKKNQKNVKGNETTDRHMGTTNNIWRLIMEKRFKLSGLSGAVATCAILAVVGIPAVSYITTQSEQVSDTAVKELAALSDNTESLSISGGEAGNRVVVATEESEQRIDMAELSKGLIAREDKSDRQSPNYRSSKQRPEQIGGASQLAPTAPTEMQHGMVGKGAIAPSKPVMSERDSDDSRRNLADAISPVRRAPVVSSEAEQVAPPKSKRVEPMSLAQKRIISPYPTPIDVVPSQYEVEGQDEFSNFKDNNTKLVSSEPVSTFSIDVDTASYSFIRRAIQGGQLPQKDSVRVEELINYFDYDYKVPSTTSEPFLPTVAVYDSPWAEDKKLMHIGIKGYELASDAKPRSNLVFLIDTSGSMSAADKLPLLVNSFKLLLDTLGDDDTIAIVTYAGSAGTVLEPTKASDKHKILEALNRLRSGGSTAGAAGIEQAYALAEQGFDAKGVNRVILATDGDFNVGMTDHNALKSYIERKRDTGISLSVLGFGKGNYHDNLMQTLAQNGNGNAAYIDSLSEARKVLVEEAGSTLFTIAQDVKIQVEFNPNLVSEYRLIGYETRHLNREDFNNDKVDAGEVGAGHSVTAIYEITPRDSKNKMVDDLRYQAEENKPVTTEQDFGREYALLKMRYKLPQEGLSEFSKTSTLITRPITVDDEMSHDALSNDIRFAGAVAGFGQILRGGAYTGNFAYEDVIEIAKSARGEDEFGYRAEFLNLVRLAKSVQ